jgi:glycosyltransferase involved in cell wall biosynthesis
VNPWILRLADWLIAQRLEPCDVFIGMSGLCVESARTARERFGAKVWIERGSRHVLSQKAILDQIKEISPTADTVLDYAVKRHLDSTKHADIVVVPSAHAADSFVEYGFPRERLFINPYGVDLSMFAATPAPPQGAAPMAIYVGAWSYQKGCDLLIEALEDLSGQVRLLHVGSIADAALPSENWFVHQNPVPQDSLTEWYGRADVFVLASRQDGFGMVMSQALACGLPVVCTDRTGGQDLIDMLSLTEGVFVVRHDDPVALASAIEQAVQWAHHRFQAGETRDLLASSRHRLSWGAYGRRYSARLTETLRYPNIHI